MCIITELSSRDKGIESFRMEKSLMVKIPKMYVPSSEVHYHKSD